MSKLISGGMDEAFGNKSSFGGINEHGSEFNPFNQMVDVHVTICKVPIHIFHRASIIKTCTNNGIFHIGVAFDLSSSFLVIAHHSI